MRAADSHFAELLRSHAYGGDVAEVARLIDEGVDPNVPDKWGRTPLSLAAGAGHDRVVRLLVEKGAIVDPYEDYTTFDTPLTAAAEGGHVEIIKVLIQAGASAALHAGPSQATAEFYARQNGHLDAWELLQKT